MIFLKKSQCFQFNDDSFKIMKIHLNDYEVGSIILENFCSITIENENNKNLFNVLVYFGANEKYGLSFEIKINSDDTYSEDDFLEIFFDFLTSNQIFKEL